MKRNKTRGLCIRNKIVLPASAMIMVLCIVMGVNSYKRTEDGLVAMGVEEARMAAVISSKVVDAQKLESLTPESDGGEEYEEILVTLQGRQRA